MRRRRLRTGFAALVGTALLLSLPGCSLFLTKGPEPQVQPVPACTTSNAAPVADTALAAVSAAVLTWGAVNAFGCSSPPAPGTTCSNGWAVVPVAVGAAAAVLFSASAGVGYTRTSLCRAMPSSLVTSAGPALPASGLGPPWARACPGTTDAPRLCPSVATSE